MSLEWSIQRPIRSLDIDPPLPAAFSDVVGAPGRSAEAAALIDSPAHDPMFCAASVRDVAIRTGLARADFSAHAVDYRRCGRARFFLSARTSRPNARDVALQ